MDWNDKTRQFHFSFVCNTVLSFTLWRCDKDEDSPSSTVAGLTIGPVYRWVSRPDRVLLSSFTVKTPLRWSPRCQHVGPDIQLALGPVCDIFFVDKRLLYFISACKSDKY